MWRSVYVCVCVGGGGGRVKYCATVYMYSLGNVRFTVCI